MACILYVLSEHLERLFLDVFLRKVDFRSPLDSDLNVSLRGALHQLPKLVEYCCAQNLPWSLDPFPWGSKATLRRIASFRTNVHYKLTPTILGIPNLEVLVGAFPLLTGTQVMGTPFERIFVYGSDTFKEILFITPREDCMYTRGFKKLVGEIMDSEEAKTAGGRRGLLTVMEVEGTADQPHLHDMHARQETWFIQAALDGSLWTNSRLDWDTYCSKS